ncbi:hypothetical protein TrLO_g15253 [Triparma laevis f. longispina]|uniref:PNPLA domain-containing protein n=1 Tax=Triparma laevis f. longispina TaxID=1714387 RepID=A0A9W6ZW83_9STRA|nr:hypothetical protein TrLO_g15253 [Triparma laevis f. longispina]
MSLVGFSFSVAGLLFPYHVGVTSVLKASDVFTPATPLNGASGGALAACCAAAGLSDADALDASQKIANRCTNEGAFLKLGTILRDGLNDLVDDELLQALNERPGRVEFSYTSIKPRAPSQPFSTPKDLIDILCASSHIPLYSSINPVVSVNSEFGADGFLSSPETLGMRAVTDADTTIFVTPFSIFSSNQANQAIASQNLIAPQKGEIPFSSSDYVNLALGRPGPSPSDQSALFDLGEKCANRWLLTQTK